MTVIVVVIVPVLPSTSTVSRGSSTVTLLGSRWKSVEGRGSTSVPKTSQVLNPGSGATARARQADPPGSRSRRPLAPSSGRARRTHPTPRRTRPRPGPGSRARRVPGPPGAWPLQRPSTHRPDPRDRSAGWMARCPVGWVRRRRCGTGRLGPVRRHRRLTAGCRTKLARVRMSSQVGTRDVVMTIPWRRRPIWQTSDPRYSRVAELYTVESGTAGARFRRDAIREGLPVLGLLLLAGPGPRGRRPSLDLAVAQHEHVRDLLLLGRTDLVLHPVRRVVDLHAQAARSAAASPAPRPPRCAGRRSG